MVFKQNTADLNQLSQHLKRCNTLFEPNLDTYVNIDNYAEKIFKNATTFEIWEKNELVGLVACYLNDENQNTGYITNVSVEKYYQSKGLAKILLIKSIELSKKLEFQKLALEVESINKKAINLYESLGFKSVKVRKNKLYMEKELK